MAFSRIVPKRGKALLFAKQRWNPKNNKQRDISAGRSRPRERPASSRGRSAPRFARKVPYVRHGAFTTKSRSERAKWTRTGKQLLKATNTQIVRDLLADGILKDLTDTTCPIWCQGTLEKLKVHGGSDGGGATDVAAKDAKRTSCRTQNTPYLPREVALGVPPCRIKLLRCSAWWLAHRMWQRTCSWGRSIK